MPQATRLTGRCIMSLPRGQWFKDMYIWLVHGRLYIFYSIRSAQNYCINNASISLTLKDINIYIPSAVKHRGQRTVRICTVYQIKTVYSTRLHNCLSSSRQGERFPKPCQRPMRITRWTFTEVKACPIWPITWPMNQQHEPSSQKVTCSGGLLAACQLFMIRVRHFCSYYWNF